jgi:mRNA interferase MazF
VRPAVVLSVAYLDHERALITYVPRTTALRQTRFEVEHRASGFDHGAFDAQSIGTIPVAKMVRRIMTLDPAVLARVEGAVRAWLAL